LGKPGFFSENAHLCGETTPPEQSSPDSELHWSNLTVPVPLWKWHSEEELLWNSRTTLEQFAPQKILLLREIQSWSAPGRTTFLESSM
jgi:hypothetical protein